MGSYFKTIKSYEFSVLNSRLYQTNRLSAYPKYPHQYNHYTSCYGMAPHLYTAHRRRRIGQARQRRNNLLGAVDMHDFASRDFRYLFHNFRPSRSADPLGRAALDEKRRFQRGPGLLAGEHYLMPAGLMGCELPRVGSPCIARRNETNALGVAGRRRYAGRQTSPPWSGSPDLFMTFALSVRLASISG